MNVLIFPTDDRLGQVSVIEHYSRLGHAVFVPKFGSLNLKWKNIAQWPALLCLDPSGTRNLEKHGFAVQEECFGEDVFLTRDRIEINKSLPVVNICDEDSLRRVKFDVYHTLRGAEKYLSQYAEIMKSIGSADAKWISSTMNPFDMLPNRMLPHGVARIIPAQYEKYRYPCPTFNLACLNKEFDLLGVSSKDASRTGEVASFNHNFHVRHPEDYRLFEEMNRLLARQGQETVINYGGNIRGQGADVRYSNGGPVGNWPTLSPVENLKKYGSISAVVHFKQTDWGGGVFFHALHTLTPIITTRRYVEASNSFDYIVDGINSIVVNGNNPESAADAVMKLRKSSGSLQEGMKLIRDKLINETYWQSWDSFLKSLVQS